MSLLLAVTGRTAGVRYPLEATEIVVGRSSSCQIQLLDEAISRRHFRLSQSDQGWTVEDLGAQITTLRNGRPVTAPTRLEPGDVLAAGPVTFVFEPALDYLRAPETDVIIAEHVDAETQTRSVLGDEGMGTETVLLQIVARALQEKEPRQLLDAALEVVAQRFSAERAFLMAAPPTKRPRVVASFGEGPITVSRTVVEQVLQRREGVVSGDAAQDLAFSGGVSLMAGEIRSLLAAPLILDGQAVGMVHLDRKKRGLYGPHDLEALIPLAHGLAIVFLASQGIESLKRKARAEHRLQPPDVIAESPQMRQVIAQAERAAKTSATVLLTGETGTGKEVLARLIHTRSDRAAGPFVAVNCGALPETLEESELFGHVAGAFTGAAHDKVGLFESAQGGTLFLDEVAECGKATQVKLLRALQERVLFRVGGTTPVELDVRIVAATSRDLEDMILQGQLREDLYFRLKVVHLKVPPLSVRPEDLQPLAHFFVEQVCGRAGVPKKELSEGLLAALARHSWPGNVRELSNVMERMVILASGPVLMAEDLPHDLLAGRVVAARATRAGETLAAAVKEVEREMILRAMARTGGVKTAAAEGLGISRVTLDAKLKSLGLTWRKS